MKILGIESSCDETAVAVVEDGRKILSSEVSSQIEAHRVFGGVVPEIASRMHVEAIASLTRKALTDAGCTFSDLDAVAVTYAPGLIGALLVGVNFAKGLALSCGLPLVPVHHLRGHIAANYLTHPALEPPMLCLVASGGHSHIVMAESYTDFTVLGRTRDDAAGEAFDKAARVLGFPYPGGASIDKAAKLGDPSAVKLPRPSVDGAPYDFSFSGLKTAVINHVHHAEQTGQAVNKNDVAASFQAAVVDILAGRLMLAAHDLHKTKIAVAGGVSANSGLRARVEADCKQHGYELYLPALSLCGDNAAMIACQGYYEFKAGHTAGADLNASACMEIV